LSEKDFQIVVNNNKIVNDSMMFKIHGQDLFENISKREFLFWHDRKLTIQNRKLVYYKTKYIKAGGTQEVSIPINKLSIVKMLNTN